jgi:hypothetical protein
MHTAAAKYPPSIKQPRHQDRSATGITDNIKSITNHVYVERSESVIQTNN